MIRDYEKKGDYLEKMVSLFSFSPFMGHRTKRILRVGRKRYKTY